MKGFTLIELMIVVSIIGILAAIGIVSYRHVLQNGRDAKRQGDLGVIQSALELYHSDQFVYPLGGSTCGDGILVLGCFLKDPAGKKTYTNLVLSDPLKDPYPQYVYVPLDTTSSTPATCVLASKCASYCIYAALENGPKGADGNLVFQGPGFCVSTNPDSTKYNFAVSPP